MSLPKYPLPDSFTPTLMCHRVPWTPTGMTGTVLNVCSKDNRSSECQLHASGQGRRKQRPHRKLPKYNQGEMSAANRSLWG